MDGFQDIPNLRRVATLSRQNGAHLLHFHAQVELLYVTVGHVTVTINGETVCAEKGTACLAGSYDLHAYVPDEDGEGVVFTFLPEDAASFFARAKGQVVTRHFFQDENLSRTLDMFYMLATSEQQPNDLLYEGFAGVVLGLLYNSLGLAPEESGTLSTMRAVLTYIRQHADEPLRLEELSARFGYGKFYFSYLFHKYTDLNLCKFVNAVRSEKVAALLKQGEDVRFACKAAGFASVRTFYRSFTEVYGTTPQKYAMRACGTKSPEEETT
ncbi:MAG: AraC family transcriptional regulator [Clostridiales bacterium]|nr:AraC family transcriptional regulator [Clostridiales bacterium]